MKIVHLIAPAAAGGAESAVRSLAIGQRALGEDVEVATLTCGTKAHPFVEQLRADGIRVTDLRLGRRDYLAESRALSELLWRRQIDILHTHVYHADSVGYVGAFDLGVPQVATMHGFTGGGIRLRAYARLDMWVLRRCAAVIAVSENVRESAIEQGVDPGKLHLVQNGYAPIDGTLDRDTARAALRLPLTSPTIGWVGRLSLEKGADMALEAFGAARNHAAHLCVVGDGPERVNLELIARHLRLASDRVHFTGHVAGASRYLNAFDVLLLSSRSEGTPMILLEAMAAGVPIVTFDVGGVPAMLDSESALLVAHGDVRALSRAVSFALDCPAASACRAAQASARFGERFTVTAYAANVMEVYNCVRRARFAPKRAVVPARRSPELRSASSMYRSASR